MPFPVLFLFNENFIFAIFAEMKNSGFFQLLKKRGFQGDFPSDEIEPFERDTSQKCYPVLHFLATSVVKSAIEYSSFYNGVNTALEEWEQN